MIKKNLVKYTFPAIGISGILEIVCIILSMLFNVSWLWTIFTICAAVYMLSILGFALGLLWIVFQEKMEMYNDEEN